MIRFIDLTGQITADENEFYFAWYNTVDSSFISIDDAQIWDSWEEFEKDIKENGEGWDLARFKRLFPENKKTKHGFRRTEGPFKDCECPSHIESGNYPLWMFDEGLVYENDIWTKKIQPGSPPDSA